MNRRRLYGLMAGALCACSVGTQSGAAPQGTVDVEFGNGGKVVIPFDLVAGGDDGAFAVAAQPDGKLVVVGSAEKLDLDIDFAMLRLRRNGDLDLSFGFGGRTMLAFDLGGSNTDFATAVAIQPDGAIVVGGTVTGTDGDQEFAILRLGPDGKLDPTFGINGRTIVEFDLGSGNDDIAWDVAIQQDGKILAAGSVDGPAGYGDFGLVRLTAAGAPDETFGVNGIRAIFFDLGGANDDVAHGVAIQPTGEILLAGPVTIDWGNVDMGVVRLNANSTNDVTFGNGGAVLVPFDLSGPASDVAFDLLLQDDGKILLAGGASTDPDWDFAVARLDETGVLDGAFSGDGKVTLAFDQGGSENDIVRGVTLEPDGRIVVGGSVDGPGDNKDFGVARLNTDGTPDTSFGSAGKMTVAFDLGGFEHDDLSGLAIASAGGIFLVGAVEVPGGGTDFGVAKVAGEVVFASGFESSDPAG